MPRSFSKTLLTLLALVLPCLAQGQHPAWRNYTINEGLPSNDVLGLMQDSRGYLWMATSQGICSFNGYEFRRPADTSVLASSSALDPWEDAQGRIWFSHLPASLWRIENDSVRSWEYNAVLSANQRSFGYAENFAIEKDGTIWIAIDQLGYLVVGADGSWRLAPAAQQTALHFTRVNGKVLEVAKNNPADATLENQVLKNGHTAEVFHWQANQAVALGRLPLTDPGKGVRFRAWRLRNGDFLLCRLQTFYLVRDNRLIWHGQKDVYVEDIQEDDDGAILLASIAEGVSGLLRYPSRQHFERDEFTNLLPGHEVMSILRDREGGWWAATRDAGIFYCKNPRLDIFDASTGLPSDHVQRLSSDGHNLYAGLRPFDICMIPGNGARPLTLPRPPGTSHKEMTALRFDTETGRLWCGADLCFWENKRWTFSDKTAGLSNSPANSISAQNITPDPGGKVWWAEYRQSFASVDRRSGLATAFMQTPERLFSVTPDADGQLWVTTLNGLRIWRGGRFALPPFDHPALRFPLRGLEMLPDQVGGGMVIRLRGGGLLIRTKNGQFTHLTRRDGLLSDAFSELDVTPEGVLYACSNAGLNRLTRRSDGTWRIEAITVKHGLPSNQVNDVALVANEMWIATDRGVARFREDPVPVPMPAPQLEYFRVNNRAVALTPGLRLPYDQNNVSLRFLSLHFRSEGDIPYRYRMLGADTTFVYSNTREVNFAQLPAGQYAFEVQAQNEDGQWSESARFAFEILPPWWATWWFRLLMGVILVAAAGAFFQNRLQNIRREAAEREKARELETAALRAQMNPHFIFNCLQAIQAFIAQNDREAAAGYLARFAKLVRLALHGSVDGRHTLAEEMAMLDHYLHLEQLRFRGKFTFSVRAADGLDPGEITLPPLLVQPFVENALIHGLSGRENGGFVEVVFTKNGERLEVSVTDNGTGFLEKHTGKDAKGLHKSVGMMLTQKRLDLLSGAGQAGFSREAVLDAAGQAAGTRIRLEVPVVFATDEK